MVTVSYHDTVTKLQAPTEGGHGPFGRRAWFALLEEHGARPVIAAAEDGGASIALPLEREGGALRSLRHVFAFTWRPLAEGRSTDALRQAIARDLRKQAFRVDLAYLPQEDGLAQAMERAFATAGWMVRLDPCDENHVLVPRGRTFAEYWAQRPGTLRTTLKRKSKKVAVTIIDRFDPETWKDFEKVYTNSWKADEKDDDLLADFARMEGAAGRLRLGIARKDGAPVAAQFWTVDGGIAYIHKLAYDEAHRHLSAGTTLSAAMFEHVIDIDRVAMVDFGTGSDGYKRDWMEEVRTRYHLTCIDPRQARGLWFVMRKLLARLARPLRRG